MYTGPKGSYSFFAGRDASRSFVTGKFKEDLNDEVKDFTPEQHASLLHWKTFFENNLAFYGLGVRFSYVFGDGRESLEDILDRSIIE